MTFIGTNLNMSTPLGAYFIPVNNTSGLETLYGYTVPELWYDNISYNIIRTVSDMLFFIQQKVKIFVQNQHLHVCASALEHIIYN